MKKIALSGKNGAGLFATVDDEDFALASSMKWHIDIGGYAVRKGPRPRMAVIFLHRLINKTPDGLFTDHINGDKLDNRRANLRTVNKSQNACNSKHQKRKVAPYRGIGVDRRTGRWHARLNYLGKLYKGGNFDTPEDAHAAYLALAERVQGEFAYQK